MNVDTVCVNEFTFVPEEDTYFGYISKLGQYDLFKRLYPEDSGSDEEGFRVMAHSDPSMWVEYMLADVEHEDGNISAWVFVAVPDAHTMRMGKLDSKVRVINF